MFNNFAWDDKCTYYFLAHFMCVSDVINLINSVVVLSVNKLITKLYLNIIAKKKTFSKSQK